MSDRPPRRGDGGDATRDRRDAGRGAVPTAAVAAAAAAAAAPGGGSGGVDGSGGGGASERRRDEASRDDEWSFSMMPPAIRLALAA